jgi:hypothetical protein
MHLLYVYRQNLTGQFIVSANVYKLCRIFPASDEKQKFVDNNVADTIIVVGDKFYKQF